MRYNISQGRHRIVNVDNISRGGTGLSPVKGRNAILSVIEGGDHHEQTMGKLFLTGIPGHARASGSDSSSLFTAVSTGKAYVVNEKRHEKT